MICRMVEPMGYPRNNLFRVDFVKQDEIVEMWGWYYTGSYRLLSVPKVSKHYKLAVCQCTNSLFI